MQCNPSYLFLFTLLLSAAALSGQSAHRNLRSGDKAYRNGAFEKSENSYLQAVQTQPDAQSSYNLGNALYQQNKYDAAVQAYEKAARSATDPDTRAKAMHNLGNAHFQQNQWDKAIDAYKAALRNRPGDAETSRNLALAQRENHKQKAESQKQPQPADRNEDPGNPRESAESQVQNEESKEQPQPADRKKESGTPRPSAESGGSSRESNRQKTSGPQEPGAGNPKPSATRNPEADQLLQIMAREEQKVQQRLRRAGSAVPKSAKDW